MAKLGRETAANKMNQNGNFIQRFSFSSGWKEEAKAYRRFFSLTFCERSLLYTISPKILIHYSIYDIRMLSQIEAPQMNFKGSSLRYLMIEQNFKIPNILTENPLPV